MMLVFLLVYWVVKFLVFYTVLYLVYYVVPFLDYFVERKFVFIVHFPVGDFLLGHGRARELLVQKKAAGTAVWLRQRFREIRL
jgi:hypothetical protein